MNTAEIVELYEALPPDKRTEVEDFARFLLARTEDHAWESSLGEPKVRPKLEEFLQASAQEADEPLDLRKL